MHIKLPNLNQLTVSHKTSASSILCVVKIILYCLPELLNLFMFFHIPLRLSGSTALDGSSSNIKLG